VANKRYNNGNPPEVLGCIWGTVNKFKGLIMSSITFSPAIAEQLYISTEQFPVDFDDAWQWLGYSKKDKALDTLKSYFIEGEDFAFLQKGEWRQDGRSSDLYSLTVNCFKEFGMIARTVQGKLVRKYFLECETRMKQLAELVPMLEAKIDDLQTYIANNSLSVKANSVVEELLDMLSACKHDPLAVNRYANAIETLNTTIHRNQQEKPTERQTEQSEGLPSFLQVFIETSEYEFTGNIDDFVIARDFKDSLKKYLQSEGLKSSSQSVGNIILNWISSNKEFYKQLKSVLNHSEKFESFQWINGSAVRIIRGFKQN